MRHSRPVEEKREVLVTELAIVGTMVALAVAGYGWQVLYYYFLPNKLAIMLLAYAFDYVPHRPHKTARTEDEYRTTSKIDGLYGVKGLDLAVPLLFQNYHNIHHLYPQVPFYRYDRLAGAPRRCPCPHHDRSLCADGHDGQPRPGAGARAAATPRYGTTTETSFSLRARPWRRDR